MAKCIALDIDCAEICALAASVMGRASETSKQVCSACAQVCQMCGDECAKHQMQHCQDAIGPRDKNDTLAAHVCWGAFVRRKSLLLAFQAREHRSLTQIKEQLH